MLGWHFLKKDRRLQYGDRELVEPGRTYTAIGPLSLCQNGMHASRRALDALTYAPGPIVCRVRLSGELSHDSDKTVARSRTVLWLADSSRILHEFALSVATDVLCAYEATGQSVDPCWWMALETKQRWLDGKVTLEELEAEDIVWDAAERAATIAILDAVWEAIEFDRDVVLDTYNIQFETMLESLR